MEVRSRQDAKSVCIKRRHGAMSAGELLEEDCFVSYVKTVALIGLRCCGRGRTYCCSYRVRTGFLVPQPYDDVLETEGR